MSDFRNVIAFFDNVKMEDAPTVIKNSWLFAKAIEKARRQTIPTSFDTIRLKAIALYKKSPSLETYAPIFDIVLNQIDAFDQFYTAFTAAARTYGFGEFQDDFIYARFVKELRSALDDMPEPDKAFPKSGKPEPASVDRFRGTVPFPVPRMTNPRRAGELPRVEHELEYRAFKQVKKTTDNLISFLHKEADELQDMIDQGATDYDRLTQKFKVACENVLGVLNEHREWLIEYRDSTSMRGWDLKGF